MFASLFDLYGLAFMPLVSGVPLHIRVYTYVCEAIYNCIYLHALNVCSVLVCLSVISSLALQE